LILLKLIYGAELGDGRFVSEAAQATIDRPEKIMPTRKPGILRRIANFIDWRCIQR